MNAGRSNYQELTQSACADRVSGVLRVLVGGGHVAILIALLAASAGCRPRTSVRRDYEPWKAPDHGNRLILLKRWAEVYVDDDEQVYFVDFVAEDKVNDDNISILDTFPKIRYLDLRGTSVTDYGLQTVQILTDLERLQLPDNISDVGLEHLKGLDKLRFLYIGSESLATSEAVKQLQKALPKADIRYRDVFSN